MSYQFYKVLHIVGILMVFSGLVGVMALRMVSAELAARPRRLFFLVHGIGMLVALVAGFGLAARLGYMSGLPTWVWVKLFVWLLLGVGIAIAKRRGHLGVPVLTLFIGLGWFAAWLAITKPF